MSVVTRVQQLGGIVPCYRLIDGTTEREGERERRLNYDRIEVFMCWVCLCHCDLLVLVLFLCVYAFVHMYV